MRFSTLGLTTELVRAVDALGYDTPTPVQEQAIPMILSGRDVMAGAQTGTGKTAGFTLPMLHRLFTTGARRGRGHRPVRALVLTPTRELAAQVEESVRSYSRFLPLHSTVMFGGVGFQPQVQALRRGVDVLVATPGRLLDHMNQKTVDLSRVEFLVLDEADRMLDMGFIRDIRKVIAAIPGKRQNLLFSATFSDEIRKLAGEFLRNPAQIDVAPRNATAEKVTHVVHPVDRKRKRALLSHLIGEGDWKQVLVFTRTKHGANRLSQQLEKDGITAAAIHGNKSQGARTRALASFKKGTIRALVATDIAARGLDIEQLPYVVNYELPNVPEDYVHRIGRTARAGMEGRAVSLVCVDEAAFLRGIERLIDTRIPKEVIEGFAPDPSIAPEPILLGGRGQRRGNAGRPGGNRTGHPARRNGRQEGAGNGNGAGNSARRRKPRNVASGGISGASAGNGEQARRPRRRRSAGAAS